MSAGAQGYLQPFVSVVIVNHNYSRFIPDAIHSVKCQSYIRFECHVVDNGSTDDSVSIISGLIADDRRFTLHRLEANAGHIGAALRSLEFINGDFVVFLDADDILFPNYRTIHI